MRINKASPAIRFFFMSISAVIWLGIWGTGFTAAHWLLYVPAIFLGFAAATGICPGLILSNRVFLSRKSG